MVNWIVSCIWGDSNASGNWGQQWHLWIGGCHIDALCWWTVIGELLRGVLRIKTRLDLLRQHQYHVKPTASLFLEASQEEQDQAFIVFHKPSESGSTWLNQGFPIILWESFAGNSPPLLAQNWSPLLSKGQHVGMDLSIPVLFKLSVVKDRLFFFLISNLLRTDTLVKLFEK